MAKKKQESHFFLYIGGLLILMYAFGTRLEKSAILDEVELVTGLLKEDDYIITAHRGFSSRRAENSKEALVLASDQRYVDFIEFDVRLTSDGKLVLSHDNKAPDGTIISEATYDEIVAKTFTYHVDTSGSLFGSASEGFIRARNEELDGKEYSIIGLREAVEACKDKKILIDIKFEHDIPELTRELVRELSGVDKSNIVFQSLNAEGIKYFQETTGYNCQLLVSSYEQIPYMEGFMNIGISKDIVSYEIVHSLLEQGKSVSIWTVNTMEEFEALQEKLIIHFKDVGYITNNPDLIVTLLAKKEVQK